MTTTQLNQINKIRTALDKARSKRMTEPRVIPTVEYLFEPAPEGDFDWDTGPQDVGTPWACDDSDCPHDWHQSSTSISMGREGGNRWFIVYNDSHSDGDAEPCAGWDEREGDEPTEDIMHDLWFYTTGDHIDHFYWWGIYSLYVAETGEDPLGNWFKGPPSFEDAIRSAEENLKYLAK